MENKELLEFNSVLNKDFHDGSIKLIEIVNELREKKESLIAYIDYQYNKDQQKTKALLIHTIEELEKSGFHEPNFKSFYIPLQSLFGFDLIERFEDGYYQLEDTKIVNTKYKVGDQQDSKELDVINSFKKLFTYRCVKHFIKLLQKQEVDFNPKDDIIKQETNKKSPYTTLQELFLLDYFGGLKIVEDKSITLKSFSSIYGEVHGKSVDNVKKKIEIILKGNYGPEEEKQIQEIEGIIKKHKQKKS